MAYKEIKFNKKQKGYGLTVTNPATGSRALVGIFKRKAEAEKVGEKRRQRGSVKHPRVVKWNEKNYKKYNLVFKK
jgi:hypothetical protein